MRKFIAGALIRAAHHIDRDGTRAAAFELMDTILDDPAEWGDPIAEKRSE